ncbi:UDP-N-acetylglucosamine 1-carboxyvinyltransferase [bacterium]|jgi:UDP-N-acetylglucosamine 1-carboxyvinyltransferase|nr:UDP-N-acetylglucosamine 1-carboxyvinyltransferase [bacterium]
MLLHRMKLRGGKPLHGTVRSSGAKNAALPLLAACLMQQGHYELDNVPNLTDVMTMIRMLNSLGIRAEYHENNKVKIWNKGRVKHIAPYELVTAMRASFFVAGPILAMTGYAKVPLPGGCAIGSRPLDLHFQGFKKLGATITIEHGFVEMKAKKLVGDRIYLDFPSVGATENIMMAAALAEGETLIENAAQEPEIVDLGEFLISGGAKIEGLGSSTIRIMGVKTLMGQNYSVIPDRIEVGTLMIAGAITKGDVTVEGVVPDHIEPLIRKMKEAGVHLTIQENSIRVIGPDRIQAVDIETLPFPGFPTDMQAQMMSLLTFAEGTSIVKETIFENRFMHAHELMRMGAKIKLDRNHAILTGVTELSGAEVKITDLRAGAALVLAGLAAKGETEVYGLEHLWRGYDRITQKLQLLGAEIIE